VASRLDNIAGTGGVVEVRPESTARSIVCACCLNCEESKCAKRILPWRTMKQCSAMVFCYGAGSFFTNQCAAPYPP